MVESSTAGYALMLPPVERRYVWSPVWARERVDGGEQVVVGLARVLEDVACEHCREDMVLSHIEVLSQWTELAADLLEDIAGRSDPRRDGIGRVLVFFAGDLGGAVVGEGVAGDLDEDVVVMAMTAVTEAMVVASSCLALSFSKQLASTL